MQLPDHQDTGRRHQGHELGHRSSDPLRDTTQQQSLPFELGFVAERAGPIETDGHELAGTCDPKCAALTAQVVKTHVGYSEHITESSFLHFR